MKKESATSVSKAQKSCDTKKLTDVLESEEVKIEAEQVKIDGAEHSKSNEIEFVFYRHLERLFRRN